MDYIINKDYFGVYELKNTKGLIFDGFYSIINELDYYSVVCKKIKVKNNNIISLDEGYNLISVKIQYDPNITGILSKIADMLSKKGISFYVITTYNYGHFLIPKDLINKAEKIFKRNYF